MDSTAGPRTNLTIGQPETDLKHITITRYTTGAGVVVLLYDSLLTFGDEVRAAHAWKRGQDMARTHSLHSRTGSIGLAGVPHSR